VSHLPAITATAMTGLPLLALFSAAMAPPRDCGDSPLCDAVFDGELRRVAAALARFSRHDLTAQLVAVDARGMAVLSFAAALGHADVASALLEAGAAVDAVDSGGWTALFFAIKAGHAGVMALLLERGASVAALAADGATVLHVAHQFSVRAALNAGADVELACHLKKRRQASLKTCKHIVH